MMKMTTMKMTIRMMIIMIMIMMMTMKMMRMKPSGETYLEQHIGGTSGRPGPGPGPLDKMARAFSTP